MRTKHTIPIFTGLILLSAVSAIALFISGWNNFPADTGKPIFPLLFLVFALLGLLASYLLIIRDKVVDEWHSQPETIADIKQEISSDLEAREQVFEKEISVNLLKGVSNRNDPKLVAEKILKNLASEFEIAQGIVFLYSPDKKKFTHTASYAGGWDVLPKDFELGEGLSGQAAYNKRIMILTNIPDSYSPVISGLGRGKPRFLYIIPLVHENHSVGVIEISCFKEIEDNYSSLLNHLIRDGGQKFHSFIFPDNK